MTEQVVIEAVDGVLTVRFNRPEKKNALTQAMYSAVTEAIARVEREPALKVLVITGTGDMFTSGNDVGDFLTAPPDSESSPVVAFLAKLSSTDIPIIAAVNGRAVGVGTTLLMHCEKVYAVESAMFNTPFINLAVVPEAGSSLLMPKFLGYQRAARMLVFGEAIDAQTARDCGLVSELTTSDALMSTVMDDARRIAKLPKKAMLNAKRLMRAQDEALDARMAREMEDFGAALAAPEAQEAMQAFLEKRPADFSKVEG